MSALAELETTRAVASFQPLQPGVVGTRQTLELNRKHVRADLLDPEQRVRRCCLAILENAGAKGGDRIQEAQALWDWIVSTVTFRRDPTNVQLAVAPSVVLKAAEELHRGTSREPVVGNCNTHASLFAILGHSVRLQIVWVLIGPGPENYSHIYPAMELVEGSTDEHDLLALDTATTEPRFGVHSREVSRWVVDPLDGF